MSNIHQHCYWLATGGPYQPDPPLHEDLSADVAIVGAGFAGLSSAYHLRRADPSLRVVVLERDAVGFGASGRNGSFVMTCFAYSAQRAMAQFGRERARQAHEYGRRALRLVGELVAEHGIDCEFFQPGWLQVADAPGYVRSLRAEWDALQTLGAANLRWLGRDEARAEVNSPLYHGAIFDPEMGLVHPARLARGLGRAARQAGAQVFEHSPVVAIERTPGGVVVTTPGGRVSARKLVFAANAYSHLFPLIRRKQAPQFTYMVATAPLSEAQRAEVGWKNRQGISDVRNFGHYYRLSADGRLLIGGGPIGYGFAGDMDRDYHPGAFAHLQQYLGSLFPGLKGIRIDYRWGGPFSVTADLAPAIGFAGDRRIVYVLGCGGHGVSLSHLHGQVVRDLILERQTDLTDLFFVNRRLLPWPPEPLRYLTSQIGAAVFAAQDWAAARRRSSSDGRRSSSDGGH